MTLLGFQLGVVAGIGLVVLGLGGMLLRRSIVVVVMSCAVSVLGATLCFVSLASAQASARGVATGLLLLLLSAAWSIAGVAAALASYRRRGTENIDELRELRG